MKNARIGLALKTFAMCGVLITAFSACLLYSLAKINESTKTTGNALTYVEELAGSVAGASTSAGAATAAVESATMAVQETASIFDQQQQALVRQSSVQALDQKVLELTYWMTDLSLSWLNESEEQAEHVRKEIDGILDSLQATDPDFAEATRLKVDELVTTMMPAVDAYVDKNRVLGNSITASGRRKAAQMRSEIAVLLAEVVNDATESAGAAVSASTKAAEASQDAKNASGEVLAAAKTAAELSEATAEASQEVVARNESLGNAIWVLLGISVPFGLVLSLWFAHRMKASISTVAQKIAQLAEGDLATPLLSTRSDEIGDLARDVEEFRKNLQGSMRTIVGCASDISGASSNLLGTATELSHGAELTGMQSSSVSTSAEEMSSNMAAIASSSELMTDNVKTVAIAIDEMTKSIGEIAKNAEHSSSVASSAVELAESSNQGISKLRSAADEIGNVIETIQDIAEQTNLLALNATIEAARAGESGKGFAVVATEVKELAKQTANATEDIRNRIEGIQLSTGEVVNSIGQISEVIGQVNDVFRTIAASVEQQSTTTLQISQSITQTSEAATAVCGSVAESRAASREITENITKMDTSFKKTAEGVSTTRNAGEQLTQVATQLEELVGQFAVS